MVRYSSENQKNRACNLFVFKIAKNIGFSGCEIAPIESYTKDGRIVEIFFEVNDRALDKIKTITTRWEFPKDKRKTPVFLTLC